jgi:hypothetical protein
MTWKEFLKTNCTRYRESRDWQAAGLSWAEVLRTWPVGNDLLWAAREMGLLDDVAASRVACACVDAVADLAPDVDAIVGAVWQGDMTAAAFGAACILGNAEGKEVELPTDGEEPIMPIADVDVHPGEAKACYASTLLLDDTRPYLAMYHAIQARVHDARDAWAQAVAANESKPVIAELEAAVKRVEASEHLAQADFMRWLLGGLA